MTFSILLVLLILTAALASFVSERLPMDLTALMVLLAVAMTGLVEPAEAISAFSNPAVVTIAAMFVLTGGLSRTGVAGRIGRQIDRLSKGGEGRLLAALMGIACLLSAFMNNVGVAALLLPPAIELAKRRGLSPSRLLMPLSFAALLGGLITLIGTSPNVILAGQLAAALPGEGFGFFDFTPVGLAVSVVGTVYMVLVGPRLLPRHRGLGSAGGAAAADEDEPSGPYDLAERLFTLRLPQASALAGLSLAQSRLGSALSLNVLAIDHGDEGVELAPEAGALLHEGDRLVVRGRLDHFEAARSERHLVWQGLVLEAVQLTQTGYALAQLTVHGPPLLGDTLVGQQFRQRFGPLVLGLRRADGSLVPFDFHYLNLHAGDQLLLIGRQDQLERLSTDAHAHALSRPAAAEALSAFGLDGCLYWVRVEPVSPIVGRSLVELRPESFGLTVVGVQHGEDLDLLPDPRYRVRRGDRILVKGRPDQLSIVQAYKDLVVEQEAPDLAMLETEDVAMVEAALSPHTTLVGKTLRAIHFRERYGLSVLALWREGRALRTRVKDIPLRFGDALLLFGRRSRFSLLAGHPDFLLLSEGAQMEPRHHKAGLAALIFVGGVVLPTALLGVPIELSSLAGAVAMVLVGCLEIQEAYRYIQWRSLFLIAGMLPLGLAMDHSGAARLLAEYLVAGVGPWGPMAVMGSIFVVGALAAQVMPSPAVALLLGPITLTTAAQSGVSPRQLIMVLAVAASSSFFSPVGHPANVLVMGPGGYRFSDFVRVGLPLTALIMITALLTVPVFIR